MTPRSIPLRTHWLTLALAVTGAAGCGELQDVPSGVCGNAVKEAHEDCDTFAEKGRVCNSSCHYACTSAANCPDGSACGLDGICHFDAACSPDGTCKYATQDPSDRCQVDAGSDPSAVTSGSGISGRPCPCGDPSRGENDTRICRLTSGTYVPFGDMVPVPAAQVRLGDFDGDGLQDLLTLGVANPAWLAYPRIQFFEQPSGQVTDIFDPRIPITSPSIVSLYPSDPRRQIVFSTSAGISTFDVAANRTVLPIAYPIQQMPESWSYRMGLLKGTTKKPYGEAVIIYTSAAASQSGNGAIAVADTQQPLAPLPKDFSGLLEPIAANVVDTDSPCDEALLAFNGDSNVYMLSPCDSVGNLITQTTPPPSVLTLSGGRTIAKAPRVGLINPKNSNLDLLLVDDKGGVYASFGDGKGTFSADPSNPTETAAMAWPVFVEVANDCPYNAPVDGQFPLALADLNADGYTDWVSPSGIQLTKSVTIDPVAAKVTITACTVNAPFVGTWTVAKVADLNGDGRLDVVAGSYDEQNAASAPDLDFFQGTGTDFLNGSGIITAGPSEYLIIGDFDGDLINDVAFTETQPTSGSGASGSTIDRLAIAFGNTSGPPSAPVEIGRFSSVKQTLAGKYAGNDSIDEIGVIAEPSDGTGQQLSVFIGTPSRHPFAPLGLAKFLSDQEISQSPLASAVGNLSLGAQPYPSIVSVSADCSSSPCDYRVWIVPGNATGGFEAPIPCEPLRPDFADFVPYRQEQGQVAVALAMYGADANFSAEAYALTSGQGDGTTILWRIRLPTTSGDWTDPQPVEKVTVLVDGEIGVGSNPVLVDFDDDGYLDLAVILYGPNGLQRLAVCYGDGKTGPTRNCAYMDALAITNFPDSVALKHTRGFAVRPLSIRDQGELKTLASLAAVTDAGTYAIIIPPTNTGRSMPSIKRMESLPSGSSIDVGDVNGDGLVDFAIAVPGGVQLFTEQPCSDASCDQNQVQP